MTGPIIQVINRQDFRDQKLIELHDHGLPTTLPPNSIRVRTELFTISINSFTYARLGHLPGFAWWDIHTIPDNAPAPYNDTSKWGRIPCWGIGVVTESNTSIAPVGTKFYGYLPLGTQECIKEIKAAEDGIKDQFIETTAYRKDLMAGFYNRYFIQPAGTSEKDLAWNSVMQVLFETSYLINRFAFTWDPEKYAPIFPTGKGFGEWSKEDADLKDSIVLIFAASSKTGASMAQQIKTIRPADQKPRKTIAVGSQSSKAMTEGFGWVDDVVLYGDDPVSTLQSKGGLDKETRVVIFDFGGRDGSAMKWAAAVKEHAKAVSFITVGSSPDIGDALPEGSEQGIQSAVGNALGLRLGAIENVGGAQYYEEFFDAWNKFKKDGGLPGIEFDISDGLESMVKGWDGLADGKIPGTKALLYHI